MERANIGLFDRMFESAIQTAADAAMVVWYNWIRPLIQRDRSVYYAIVDADPLATVTSESLLDSEQDNSEQDDSEEGDAEPNIVHV